MIETSAIILIVCGLLVCQAGFWFVCCGIWPWLKLWSRHCYEQVTDTDPFPVVIVVDVERR